jgi:predicted GNAT family N-acyltransferase
MSYSPTYIAKRQHVILIKPWQEAKNEAYLIRKRVFIEEQGVPEDMELDVFDPLARHALAYLDSQPIGTARLVTMPGNIGRIGRMAVLAAYRRGGVGTQLLRALLQEAASQKMMKVELHSQLSAIPFYERYGFVAQGDSYVEAGIPHRDMILHI